MKRDLSFPVAEKTFLTAILDGESSFHRIGSSFFRLILKVIEIKRLTFSYRRETPVLDDVSFSVRAGDFCVLIGSNGTGKSTLLKLLLRQLTPDSGEISFFGEKLATFRNWRRVGYVPQGHSYLNSDFPATVEEVLLAHQYPRVGIFGRIRREHREKVAEVLKLVDMSPFRTARLGTLSGGQLQRILIARALVNNPDVLILDEPTTGIDVQNAHALYELLNRLNQDFQLAILMVTHDLIHAANYAKRIFCLEDGNLAELSPDQLQHELIHRHHHNRKNDGCEHVQAMEKECQKCIFYQNYAQTAPKPDPTKSPSCPASPRIDERCGEHCVKHCGKHSPERCGQCGDSSQLPSSCQTQEGASR